MTRTSPEQTYYQILEVQEDAPPHIIHEAFQRAKKTYNRDNPALYSMFSPDEAQQLLTLIEEAFEVLGNKTLREAYDEKLRLNEKWTTEHDGSDFPLPDQASVNESSWEDNPPSMKTNSQNKKNSWSTDSKRFDDIYQDSIEGHDLGKTSLSAYPIDESMEVEIAEREIFDGEFLQKIREYKNIPLGQMSESTRISRTYLAAVEANSYKELPAPVFVRGFIVQIAKILGLDSQLAANSYIRLYKESQKK